MQKPPLRTTLFFKQWCLYTAARYMQVSSIGVNVSNKQRIKGTSISNQNPFFTCMAIATKSRFRIWLWFTACGAYKQWSWVISYVWGPFYLAVSPSQDVEYACHGLLRCCGQVANQEARLREGEAIRQQTLGEVARFRGEQVVQSLGDVL